MAQLVKASAMKSDDTIVSAVIKRMESQGTKWDLDDYFAPIYTRLKRLEKEAGLEWEWIGTKKKEVKK
jgi:hypothetical protein